MTGIYRTGAGATHKSTATGAVSADLGGGLLASSSLTFNLQRDDEITASSK